MEAIKVMQDTQDTQEAPSTTGAKPQVEAQVMEDPITNSETTTIIQHIKHPTEDLQTLDKGEECGALSALVHTH